MILFAGLFVGIFVGTIWVVVSPWLPRRLGLRVLAAIPLAISLGAFGVVQGSNSDFIVLGFDPRVVAGPPRPGRARRRLDGGRRCLARPAPAAPSVVDRLAASGVYIAISAIGALFAVGVVATFLDTALRPVGIALLVSGVSTLRWWYLRYRGADRPPQMLRVLGSGGVIAAVVLGLALEWPHIRLALGIY